MKETHAKGTIWEDVDDTKIELDFEYLEEWFS
jgi:hypothetical protein